MDIFLFALYIISGIITLDAQIKQHPAGRQFLTGLENGTINVLRWRAEADVDNDLLGIRKILLISTGVLFAVTFIMSVNNVQPNIYFLSIFLINLLLFSSVQWFLDYKNETLKMVGFLLLMVASPWALHWLGESMGIQPSFTDAFRHDLSVFGDLPTSDYQLLTDMSVILFFGLTMMLGSWIVLSTVPSILLLWSITLLNKVSFILVNLERHNVRLFFVMVNILTPLWFFLKDRLP